MQTIGQRKARILAAATLALTGVLSGCAGHTPTDVVESTSEVKSAVIAQSQGDRCVLINGQIYCY